MEIKNLQSISFKEIIHCFSISFADYFVAINDDLLYWENRFRCARVDYALSYGAFENGKMIGFIINGIDYLNGHKTAFNTGTGVIPEYRGQNIVDRLYDFAMEKFRLKGITKCTLEVIQANHRAIRVYERIGFNIKREFNCFKGEIKTTGDAVRFQEIKFEEIKKTTPNTNLKYYSWDHQNQAIDIGKETFRCFLVYSGVIKIGYFIINLKIGQLAQFEIFDEKNKENWQLLFNGISILSSSININNVDSRRHDLVWFLNRMSLENHIDQYEMEMII